MSFLLDTNVISESARPAPDPGVMAWLAALDEDQAFISVISLAELRHGIERLPASARRDRLADWLRDALPARFGARVVPVDAEIADAWGVVVARSQAVGRPFGVMDAFIAATAARRRLTLVTRNTADFEATGLPLFNPWLGGGPAA